MATFDAPALISILLHSFAVDPVVKTSSMSMTGRFLMSSRYLVRTLNAPLRFVSRFARLKLVCV